MAPGGMAAGTLAAGAAEAVVARWPGPGIAGTSAGRTRRRRVRLRPTWPSCSDSCGIACCSASRVDCTSALIWTRACAPSISILTRIGPRSCGLSCTSACCTPPFIQTSIWWPSAGANVGLCGGHRQRGLGGRRPAAPVDALVGVQQRVGRGADGAGLHRHRIGLRQHRGERVARLGGGLDGAFGLGQRRGDVAGGGARPCRHAGRRRVAGRRLPAPRLASSACLAVVLARPWRAALRSAPSGSVAKSSWSPVRGALVGQRGGRRRDRLLGGQQRGGVDRRAPWRRRPSRPCRPCRPWRPWRRRCPCRPCRRRASSRPRPWAWRRPPSGPCRPRAAP